MELQSSIPIPYMSMLPKTVLVLPLLHRHRFCARSWSKFCGDVRLEFKPTTGNQTLLTFNSGIGDNLVIEADDTNETLRSTANGTDFILNFNGAALNRGLAVGTSTFGSNQAVINNGTSTNNILQLQDNGADCIHRGRWGQVQIASSGSQELMFTGTNHATIAGNASLYLKLDDDNNSGTEFLYIQDGGNNTILQAGAGGELTLGTSFSDGLLKLSDASSNFISLAVPSISTDYTLTLPTTVGAANECLKNSGTAGTLIFGGCGTSTDPLQTIYDNDVNGSDAVLSLTTADDSLIFRNPAASGTDSGYIALFDQLNTGAVDGVRINNAGTGSSLLFNDNGTQVLSVSDSGAILANNQRRLLPQPSQRLQVQM